VTDRLSVDYTSLEWKASVLERMAGGIAAAIPRIAAATIRAGLHELPAYGIFSSLPVAADLFAICLPGTPGSLPDAVAELLSLAAAVRAAEVTYRAADAVGWARSELPTAEALVMLLAWNRLHRVVALTRLSGVPLLPGLIEAPGEALLEQTDRWVEGDGRATTVDPRTMPRLEAGPAAGLPSLLGVVSTISDASHPSTAALLRVGDDPPRYVLCLPGLQDSTGSDAGSADLPGALATLTGHSAYIRTMRRLLAGLPPGSQVLLVGHSQGGMVAEALAESPTVGRTAIVGVLTAGAPALATPVAAGVPYLALRNTGDPVPKLGVLAGGNLADGQGRGVVEFSTPGRWPSGTKHGLGSGGYLTKAGSRDPRVTRFRDQVSGFFTTGPVDVRFVQVTDSGGPLPR
jgi:pimeloyl-ACP methyl ester carboxylesterase